MALDNKLNDEDMGVLIDVMDRYRHIDGAGEPTINALKYILVQVERERLATEKKLKEIEKDGAAKWFWAGFGAKNENSISNIIKALSENDYEFSITVFKSNNEVYE